MTAVEIHNGVGLWREDYGTHSLRRAKAAMIYKRTGNLRAVQILLGHTEIESTVRYLGVDVEDALTLGKWTEVWILRDSTICMSGPRSLTSFGITGSSALMVGEDGGTSDWLLLG